MTLQEAFDAIEPKKGLTNVGLGDFSVDYRKGGSLLLMTFSNTNFGIMQINLDDRIAYANIPKAKCIQQAAEDEGWE